MKITFSAREIALCSVLGGLGLAGQISGFRIPISSIYSVSPLAATAQVFSVLVLPPFLAPVVFFLTYIPLPGFVAYSLAYCPTAAILSVVYYGIKDWRLRSRLPTFIFIFWASLNLANLLDTYIESALLGWFPMSAYWYWYFSWLFYGGWIHTAVVPAMVMIVTLRAVDKWMKPDWLARWRKEPKNQTSMTPN